MERGRGRGARGGGGGGRGGGGRNNSDPDVALSKTLSFLLRHGAEKEGLAMRPDGFSLVSDVLKCKNMTKYTVADLERVVANSDKQRFSFAEIEGKRYIRANQGHSIAAVNDLELKPIRTVADLPTGVVVHGTYKDAWELIKKKGLSRMNRNHIHFAIGLPGDAGVISGMRSSAQVLVYIDMAKALAEGVPFEMSSNGVILSTGDADGFVLCKYFKAVLDAKTGQPFDPDFPQKL